MAVIHTYHVGDTLPERELELADAEGGSWIGGGTWTLTLVDRLPDGTEDIVAVTVDAAGDDDTPDLVSAAAPDTTQVGVIRTYVRKAGSTPTDIETMDSELIYVVEP